VELRAGKSWQNDGDKIANLTAKLRGREHVTARELLSGCRDIKRATESLAYLVRDLGRAEREAVTAAERRAREEAERAALLERLEAHRDVRVTLADSFAVGNCAPGTVAWLTEQFPESLRGVRLDLPADKLQKHLSRLKRHLTVGDLLENPKVLDSYYARLAIQHAIAREGGANG
jgi:GAF domain-containing protein